MGAQADARVPFLAPARQAKAHCRIDSTGDRPRRVNELTRHTDARGARAHHLGLGAGGCRAGSAASAPRLRATAAQTGGGLWCRHQFKAQEVAAPAAGLTSAAGHKQKVAPAEARVSACTLLLGPAARVKPSQGYESTRGHVECPADATRTGEAARVCLQSLACRARCGAECFYKRRGAAPGACSQLSQRRQLQRTWPGRGRRGRGPRPGRPARRCGSAAS